jgi:excisionase family DNA binding protein
VQKLLAKHDQMREFIGKFLPAIQTGDPTTEPIRYYLGDDWLDLLILFDQECGWDVQIVGQSSEEPNLTDVYLDLRQKLRASLAVGERPSQQAVEESTIKSIMARLDSLESKAKGHAEPPPVQSPYLNAEEAAAYLRITVNALYGLVERRRLRPLPGSRKYRFTREGLDAFLMGA